MIRCTYHRSQNRIKTQNLLLSYYNHNQKSVFASVTSMLPGKSWKVLETNSPAMTCVNKTDGNEDEPLI